MFLLGRCVLCAWFPEKSSVANHVLHRDDSSLLRRLKHSRSSSSHNWGLTDSSPSLPIETPGHLFSSSCNCTATTGSIGGCSRVAEVPHADLTTIVSGRRECATTSPSSAPTQEVCWDSIERRTRHTAHCSPMSLSHVNRLVCEAFVQNGNRGERAMLGAHCCCRTDEVAG